MTATVLPPPSGRKQSIARDLQSEVDFLMGENARMRVRITHLESEASFSKIALDKSTLDVEKLRHHLQLLNKDKSSLGKDLEVARETLHMVNSCLKEAEKRIKSFSQTLTKTMAPWEQKVKILEDENVELKREVKALRLYARMPAGLPASAAPSQPPVPRHASRSRSPSPSHSPAHTQHPSPMLGQTVTLPSI
ncbi:hypothetical protein CAUPRSCDRAFT_12576 [Caulochytrium protostelioides]|uniref:Uncharacterized protein n=1 Tax=Caulochytrium protostelioides TaxID=1555241 RepID=A0A4P9WWV5_9FUNG|nr:hypothetical protein CAUPRSCDRAFT_12576 [Caulochytrium protostelioides]